MVIAPADATSVDPAWGSHDNGGGPSNMGHGTEMSGLAAYGDLAAAIQAAALPMGTTPRRRAQLLARFRANRVAMPAAMQA